MGSSPGSSHRLRAKGGENSAAQDADGAHVGAAGRAARQDPPVPRLQAGYRQRAGQALHQALAEDVIETASRFLCNHALLSKKKKSNKKHPFLKKKKKKKKK